MAAVAPQSSVASKVSTRYVVLAGNPNCGKTTLFNGLTGLRAKVGNYPGVTVERKEGRLQGAPKHCPVMVLDLPGTYSLTPQSLDEQIARDVIFNRLPAVPPPDLIVIVIDAANLQRNLYFATQIIELGYPTIVALNMVDVAAAHGHKIDAVHLGRELAVPVVPLVASTGQGVAELRHDILSLLGRDDQLPPSSSRLGWMPPVFHREIAAIGELLLAEHDGRRELREGEAALLLSDDRFLATSPDRYSAEIGRAVEAARARLRENGEDGQKGLLEARYARVVKIQQAVTTETVVGRETFSDRLDRVLTHRFWGLLVFLGVMAVMFQSIFSFAELPMQGLESGVNAIGNLFERWLAEGPLRSLLVDGVIAGVGAVIVFLPQICLLFLFIALLEDTGYMARAAFLMDRYMSKVGLHGKSFIPLISSFACAIPGIMATRTIENPKDRLATILVAPLMSCSARLPVYTLLIAACIPNRKLLGFLTLPGVTMLSMYLLGIVMALFMAWVFKRTLLKSPPPLLIMELPLYKRPVARVVLRQVIERAVIFLRNAGTVILGINIILWFLATYPQPAAVERKYDAQRINLLQQAGQPVRTAGELPERLAALETKAAAGKLTPAEEVTAMQLDLLARAQAGERLRNSFAGRLGQLIEPVIQPLGFDWKIGIGIVASFAAREVFVSTMSLVYNVGELDDSEDSTRTLAETLKRQTRADGSQVYTTLQAITLMVFYVLALQCVSTMVVVRRESGSWKWPLFQWAYMGALAWLMAFFTYQGGRFLGWGN